MRVLVFFDLPTITASDKKAYRNFRKNIIKSGFFMMQESVYCKLVPNSTIADSVIDNLCKNKPPKGLVQAIKITENQYNKMRYVVGEKRGDVEDSDERIVIL